LNLVFHWNIKRESILSDLPNSTSITVNIKTILYKLSFQNTEDFTNTGTFEKVTNKTAGQNGVAGSAALSLEQIFLQVQYCGIPSMTSDSQAAVRSCLGWVTACVKTLLDPRLHSCSAGGHYALWNINTQINVTVEFCEKRKYKHCSAVSTLFYGGFLANWNTLIISGTNACHYFQLTSAVLLV